MSSPGTSHELNEQHQQQQQAKLAALAKYKEDMIRYQQEVIEYNEQMRVFRARTSNVPVAVAMDPDNSSSLLQTIVRQNESLLVIVKGLDERIKNIETMIKAYDIDQ